MGIKSRLMLFRKIIRTTAKFSIVAGLLGWMLHSGRLNLSELTIFVDRPEISAFSIILWIIGPALLGSLRWRILLVGAGYHVTWKRAAVLQIVGFFFSSAMPGAVSGDVIKAFYIVKDDPQRGKTNAMMTVVMDRILGLCGLFMMGYCVMLVTGAHLLEIPAVRTQFVLMTAATAGIALFLVMFMYPHKEGRDPFLRLLAKEFPGAPILRKIYVAFRIFHDQRPAIATCVALSFVIQLLGYFLFAYVAKMMIGFEDFAALAIFYPVGVLTTALPLAPGGIGIGHVAFDRLFHLVGVDGGANVFNVYCLGQLALNLLGFIPYLFLRRTSGKPDDAPVLELS